MNECSGVCGRTDLHCKEDALLLPPILISLLRLKHILKTNNSMHQGLLRSPANPVPELPELLQVEDASTARRD